MGDLGEAKGKTATAEHALLTDGVLNNLKDAQVPVAPEVTTLLRDNPELGETIAARASRDTPEQFEEWIGSTEVPVEPEVKRALIDSRQKSAENPILVSALVNQVTIPLLINPCKSTTKSNLALRKPWLNLTISKRTGMVR